MSSTPVALMPTAEDFAYHHRQHAHVFCAGFAALSFWRLTFDHRPPTVARVYSVGEGGLHALHLPGEGTWLLNPSAAPIWTPPNPSVSSPGHSRDTPAVDDLRNATWTPLDRLLDPVRAK